MKNNLIFLSLFPLFFYGCNDITFNKKKSELNSKLSTIVTPLQEKVEVFTRGVLVKDVNGDFNDSPYKYGDWTFWGNSKTVKGRWSREEGINGGGAVEIDSISFPGSGAWYKKYKNLSKKAIYIATIDTKYNNIITSSPWAGVCITVQFWKDKKLIKELVGGWHNGIEESWQQLQIPFKVIDECDEVRVCAFLSASSGTVLFDNYKLSEVINSNKNLIKKNTPPVKLKLFGRKSSFFKVQKSEKGNFYLKDSNGNALYSIGLNCTTPWGDDGLGFLKNIYRESLDRKYQSKDGSIVNELWLKESKKRLTEWGFNSVGCWSSSKWRGVLPHVEIIWAGYKGLWNNKVRKVYDGFPDVFDPKFAEVAEDAIKKECKKWRNDPTLIGYFIDNELHWSGDWNCWPSKTNIDLFLGMPDNSYGREAVLTLLKKRYLSIEKMNKLLGTKFKKFSDIKSIMPYMSSINRIEIYSIYYEFCTLLAEKYFSITTSLIKKYDPNHLILGVRFAYGAPSEIVRVCGKYCDVISVNIYQPVPEPAYLERIFSIAKKPILITEFSFRAKDSGLPNTKGAGSVVENQEERAYWYDKYLKTAILSPYTVGCHFFKWVDQPKAGRANPPDGENSNYGVVNEYDIPYSKLINSMKNINTKVYYLRNDK